MKSCNDLFKTQNRNNENLYPPIISRDATIGSVRQFEKKLKIAKAFVSLSISIVSYDRLGRIGVYDCKSVKPKREILPVKSVFKFGFSFINLT